MDTDYKKQQQQKAETQAHKIHFTKSSREPVWEAIIDGSSCEPHSSPVQWLKLDIYLGKVMDLQR